MADIPSTNHKPNEPPLDDIFARMKDAVDLCSVMLADELTECAKLTRRHSLPCAEELDLAIARLAGETRIGHNLATYIKTEVLAPVHRKYRETK